MNEKDYDILYKFIQDIENTINECYENKINKAKLIAEELTLEHAFVFLLIDFDCQVSNGGFLKYVYNGYHSTTQLNFVQGVDLNYDIHKYFIKLSQKFFEKYNSNLSQNFIEILNDFKIEVDEEIEVEENCHLCQGLGYIEPEIDEEQETCNECDGDGFVIVDNQNQGEIEESTIALFDKLDKKYYAICNELIHHVSNSLKNIKMAESITNF